MAYLDNNATAPCAQEVMAAMRPFVRDLLADCDLVQDSTPALRRARQGVRRLLGAALESDILFTSGGTESNAVAIRSALRARPGRREMVTSAVEHPSVLSLCDHLARHDGYTVHVIGVDHRGRLDLESYRAALSERVAVVSIMWANNETGTVFPIEDLAEMARGHDCLFHSDAIQAAGRIPLRLASSSVDMVSVSSHILHGPKGVGALYTRHRDMGAWREWDDAANLARIVGLGKAADLSFRAMMELNTRIRVLRDQLERELAARISGAAILGDTSHRLPNTSAIAFEGVEGRDVLRSLNESGIAVSVRAACTTGQAEPSHVLRAMRLPAVMTRGAVRFSLSRETGEDEIDQVVAVLPAVVDRLRWRGVRQKDGAVPQ